MKLAQIIALCCLLPSVVSAGEWAHEYHLDGRGLIGAARTDRHDRQKEEEYHFPTFADIGQVLSYRHDEDTAVSLLASLRAQSDSYLDNLNQGHWGEEIFINFQTAYGELYFGQMPNVAAMLGVNRPNMSVWQPQPEDMADFISDPNWQQKRHRKLYNTFYSTLMDTDGSSLKISYLTPEYANTILGFSYVPKNDANDGLISKFAPYAEKDAYILTAYHHQELALADVELSLAFASYTASHDEYGVGLDIYRRGWTIFGAYRQSRPHQSDASFETVSTSANRPLGYDGFRHGKAYNVGLGYEWAFSNTILSYFESDSDISAARNRIINLHQSIRPWKNLGFYLGVARADFRPAVRNTSEQKRGMIFYTGIEVQF